MENSPIARPQERELRSTVYQLRHEVGLRTLVQLAQIERDRALKEWRGAVGEGLVKGQSRYNAMQTIIDFVNEAPREFAKPADTK